MITDHGQFSCIPLLNSWGKPKFVPGQWVVNEGVKCLVSGMTYYPPGFGDPDLGAESIGWWIALLEPPTIESNPWNEVHYHESQLMSCEVIGMWQPETVYDVIHRGVDRGVDVIQESADTYYVYTPLELQHHTLSTPSWFGF